MSKYGKIQRVEKRPPILTLEGQLSLKFICDFLRVELTLNLSGPCTNTGYNLNIFIDRTNGLGNRQSSYTASPKIQGILYEVYVQ